MIGFKIQIGTALIKLSVLKAKDDKKPNLIDDIDVIFRSCNLLFYYPNKYYYGCQLHRIIFYYHELTLVWMRCLCRYHLAIRAHTHTNVHRFFMSTHLLKVDLIFYRANYLK